MFGRDRELDASIFLQRLLAFIHLRGEISQTVHFNMIFDLLFYQSLFLFSRYIFSKKKLWIVNLINSFQF